MNVGEEKERYDSTAISESDKSLRAQARVWMWNPGAGTLKKQLLVREETRGASKKTQQEAPRRPSRLVGARCRRKHQLSTSPGACAIEPVGNAWTLDVGTWPFRTWDVWYCEGRDTRW